MAAAKRAFLRPRAPCGPGHGALKQSSRRSLQGAACCPAPHLRGSRVKAALDSANGAGRAGTLGTLGTKATATATSFASQESEYTPSFPMFSQQGRECLPTAGAVGRTCSRPGRVFSAVGGLRRRWAQPGLEWIGTPLGRAGLAPECRADPEPWRGSR